MNMYRGVPKSSLWGRLISEWRRVARAGHIFEGSRHTNDPEAQEESWKPSLRSGSLTLCFI